MKVLIIEPHPDDVVLSYYFHLNQLKNDEVYLASVASFPETIRSSKEFCRITSINYVSTDMIPDINFKFGRISLHDLKLMNYNYSQQLDKYVEMYSSRVDEVSRSVESLIAKVNPDKIVTVLGLLHPMHCLVKVCVNKLWLGDIEYMADSPYQFRRYGQKLIESSGYSIKSKIKGSTPEIDDKLKVFWNCYPTERILMRFDRQLYYEGYEISLCKTGDTA